MTKHITDSARQTGTGRVQNFTRQDREDAIHPAIATLHARPQSPDDQGQRRLAEFTRIERGHTA